MLLAAVVARNAALKARRRRLYACPSMQSEILRLELLSRYGGVWADSSVLPVRPLDEWLANLVSPTGFWSTTQPKGGNPVGSVLTKRLPGSTTCLSLPHGFTPRARCDATWVYSQYKEYQHVNTWFLAVERPHHPLIDAWLAEYSGKLFGAMDGKLGGRAEKLVSKYGIPYFLCSCSLVQITHQDKAVRAVLAGLRAPCNGDKAVGSSAGLGVPPEKSGSRLRKLDGERPNQGEKLINEVDERAFMYKAVAKDNPRGADAYLKWMLKRFPG